MENINLKLNDGSFQDYVNGSKLEKVPQVGNGIDMATLKRATKSGKTAVCISFEVLHNGERIRVQAVTTLALLKLATRAMEASEG